jgi:hypothetical protein
MSETILSVLQNDGDHDRVVLVHRQAFGNSQVMLRRESFSEDVGWFPQSTIELSPGQLGQLKQALGVLPAAKSRPAGTAVAAAHGRSSGAPTKRPSAIDTPRFSLVS